MITGLGEIKPLMVAATELGDGRSSLQPGEIYAIADRYTGQWLASATCLMGACCTRRAVERDHGTCDTWLWSRYVRQLELFPEVVKFHVYEQDRSEPWTP